jgi:hypothetical protein
MGKWPADKNMGSLWSFSKDERGQELKQNSLCVNIENYSLCHNLVTLSTGKDFR